MIHFFHSQSQSREEREREGLKGKMRHQSDFFFLPQDFFLFFLFFIITLSLFFRCHASADCSFLSLSLYFNDDCESISSRVMSNKEYIQYPKSTGHRSTGGHQLKKRRYSWIRRRSERSFFSHIFP